MAGLPRGILAAQVVHAAGESSPGDLPDGTYAVALEASDSDHLLNIKQLLDEANVPHKLIVEDDDQPMAIGVVPDKRSKLKKYFSNLPLIR